MKILGILSLLVLTVAKGQNALAISDFTKAIEINPREAGAYINRGHAYFSEGAKPYEHG